MVVTTSFSLAASHRRLGITRARGLSRQCRELGNVALLLAGLGVEGMTLLRGFFQR